MNTLIENLTSSVLRGGNSQDKRLVFTVDVQTSLSASYRLIFVPQEDVVLMHLTPCCSQPFVASTKGGIRFPGTSYAPLVDTQLDAMFPRWRNELSVITCSRCKNPVAHAGFYRKIFTRGANEACQDLIDYLALGFAVTLDPLNARLHASALLDDLFAVSEAYVSRWPSLMATVDLPPFTADLWRELSSARSLTDLGS